MFDDQIKKTNKGSQDSIYIEIKKPRLHSNLDYIFPYGLDDFSFSNKDRIQVKRIEKSDWEEIWLTVKIDWLPFIYSNGRYRGLADITNIIELEDYNHFEVDLSPYDEYTLYQEYYNGEIIRYDKNKIYWNGEVYIKKK